MLLQALQISFDRLADVCRRFRARSTLGDTPGQSWTSGHKHTVLVWLQVNAIPHHQAFEQAAPLILSCGGLEIRDGQEEGRIVQPRFAGLKKSSLRPAGGPAPKSENAPT